MVELTEDQVVALLACLGASPEDIARVEAMKVGESIDVDVEVSDASGVH